MCPDTGDLDSASRILSFERSIGSKNQIVCKNSAFVPIPVSYVTCKDNSEWSEFPKCRRKCNLDELPEEFDTSDCPNPFMQGNECLLKCKDPSLQIFSDAKLYCRESGLWNVPSFPCDKTCTVPTSSTVLSVQENGEECTEVKPGENCILSCRSHKMKLQGSQIITCASGGDFNAPMPECIYICGYLHLPNMAYLARPATDDTQGAINLIKCRRPGFTMNGEFTFEAVCNEGEWSHIPVCEQLCPDPASVIDESVVIRNPPCAKAEGDVCLVACKDTEAKMLGEPLIKCKEGFWRNSDVHCKRFCEQPHLPDRLVISDVCSRQANTQCEVECDESEYHVEGSPRITCGEDGQWAKFPICLGSCNMPSTVHKISCDTNIGGKCILKCGKNEVTFTCVKIGNKVAWDSEPSCPEPTNIECTDPMDLKLCYKAYPCFSVCTLEVGDICLIKCPKDWSILYKCMNHSGTIDWDKELICPPPKPTSLSSAELLKSDDDDAECYLPSQFEKVVPKCKLVPGKSCKVRCVDPMKGFLGFDDTVTCRNDWMLHNLPPECTVVRCGDPSIVLGNTLQFTGVCLEPFKIHKKCSVKCTSVDFQLATYNYIICMPNGKWLKNAFCVKKCSLLDIIHRFDIVSMQYCDVRPAGYCFVTCKGEKQSPLPNPFVKCGVDSKWISFPTCQTVKKRLDNCDYDDIPERFVFKVTTDGVVLRCREPEKFYLDGPPLVLCVRGLIWSEFPKCHPRNFKSCPNAIPDLPNIRCSRYGLMDECVFKDTRCERPITRTVICVDYEWTDPVPFCSMSQFHYKNIN